MNISRLESLKPLETLQITQINNEPFIIKDTIDPNILLSPLVSVETEYQDKQTVLNIKITALLPATLLGANAIELFQNPNSEKNVLKLILKCNITTQVPETYYAWYICYKHIMIKNSVIDQILTEITGIDPINANPRTSRGTYTYVLQS